MRRFDPPWPVSGNSPSRSAGRTSRRGTRAMRAQKTRRVACTTSAGSRGSPTPRRTREGASDFVGARAAGPPRPRRREAHRARGGDRPRQAADRIEEKKKAAFRGAPRARIREGEALVKCLREEMAVYAAQRAPAVGGVDAPARVRGALRAGPGLRRQAHPGADLSAGAGGGRCRAGRRRRRRAPDPVVSALGAGAVPRGDHGAGGGDRRRPPRARGARPTVGHRRGLRHVVVGMHRLPLGGGPATVRAWTESATRVGRRVLGRWV